MSMSAATDRQESARSSDPQQPRKRPPQATSHLGQVVGSCLSPDLPSGGRREQRELAQAFFMSSVQSVAQQFSWSSEECVRLVRRWQIAAVNLRMALRAVAIKGPLQSRVGADVA